jgi:NAD(P)-dependent dehydrogenase (short-subunit alcohol dehydrogenase family)
MLRAGLLEGTVVATAGGAEAIAAACAALGAATPALEADLLDEEAVTAAAAQLGAVGTLVCDAAPGFISAGGGVEGLTLGLEGAWNAARAVANAIWRPGDGGKLVLLGPRPRDGAHAGALGAALENTARTLSIEWARYAIRPTAVLPADATADDELATLVAYLASPAGDYFSGCAFDFAENVGGPASGGHVGRLRHP